MSDTVATWLIPTFISGAISIGVAVYSIKASAKTAREQWQAEGRHLSLIALGLLKGEISNNQRMLKELFGKVNWQVSGQYAEQEFQMRVHFINELLPKWERDTWDSHRINLASILTDGTIQRLTDYLTHLQSLATFQSSLKSKLPESLDVEYQSWKKAFDANQTNMQSFDDARELQENVRQYNDATRDIWNACFGIMNSLLSWNDSLLELRDKEATLHRIPLWKRIRAKLPIIRVTWPRQINPTQPE